MTRPTTTNGVHFALPPRLQTVDGLTVPQLGDPPDIRVVSAALLELLRRSVPRGGTAGQVLAKTNADDFATSWQAGVSDLAVYTRQGVLPNPNTASAAFVDIPDLNATVHLPVAMSVSAWLTVTVSHPTAAADVDVALQLDNGADDGPITTRVNVAGGRTVICSHWAWPTLNPGSHRISGRWRTSAPSVTSPETFRVLLVQHTQLYAAAPAGGVLWDEHVPGGPSEWPDVVGGWA